jgi:DNA-binding NtrC family response regulator
MRRLAEQVRLAARVRVPVLLVGEPGTGKETLARLIHSLSAEREGAFAALDCARLPPSALARVLLGQTGPLGAVYLREPARLPRDLQVRLCEWVDPGALPEGGATPPRLLAGTTAPLEAEVKAGRVVEDLACALGTLVLEVPPLRQRRDDLPRLVEALLGRCEGGAGPSAGLTPSAWEVIRAHDWPGNLSELHAVRSDARARAKGERIDVGGLPAPLRLAQQVGQAPARPPDRPLQLDQVLEQVERRLIELALRRAGGHKTRAAELLSIWRPRLQRRLEALGMASGE